MTTATRKPKMKAKFPDPPFKCPSPAANGPGSSSPRRGACLGSTLCQEGVEDSACQKQKGTWGTTCSELCLQKGESYDPQTRQCVPVEWTCVAETPACGKGGVQTCTRNLPVTG